MIDKRPLANKPPAPTLDQKISQALGNGNVASDDLQALLGEIGDAITEAEAIAQSERSKAHDPATHVAEAEDCAQRAALAALHRDRYSNRTAKNRTAPRAIAGR